MQGPFNSVACISVASRLQQTDTHLILAFDVLSRSSKGVCFGVCADRAIEHALGIRVWENALLRLSEPKTFRALSNREWCAWLELIIVSVLQSSSNQISSLLVNLVYSVASLWAQRVQRFYTYSSHSCVFDQFMIVIRFFSWWRCSIFNVFQCDQCKSSMFWQNWVDIVLNYKKGTCCLLLRSQEHTRPWDRKILSCPVYTCRNLREFRLWCSVGWRPRTNGHHNERVKCVCHFRMLHACFMPASSANTWLHPFSARVSRSSRSRVLCFVFLVALYFCQPLQYPQKLRIKKKIQTLLTRDANALFILDFDLTWEPLRAANKQYLLSFYPVYFLLAPCSVEWSTVGCAGLSHHIFQTIRCPNVNLIFHTKRNFWMCPK